MEVIPNIVVLNYSDNIPVQLSYYEITFLLTTDISIVNIPSQAIAGFDILIIFLSFFGLGFVIFYKKIRFPNK
jgi:hypothetical protein